MTIYPVLELLTVSVVAAATQRPMGGVRRLILGAAPLVAAALLVVFSGPSITIGFPDAIDVGGALLVAAVTFLGLTRPGARILESLTARRHPRVQFDRRLHESIEAYNDALRRLPPADAGPGHVRVVVDVGDRTLRTIMALRAPDAGWADVRDRYVRLIQGQLQAIENGATEARAHELAMMNQDITARARELRAISRDRSDGG